MHSALPGALTVATDAELRVAGVEHRAHGDAHPVRAAEAAAGDDLAIAFIGPRRSASVVEAVEATARVGLPLLAPVATAAAVTRDDEPGCHDPARHQGTVLRLIARDTVVAARIAADVRAADQRAVVISGRHSYGHQLRGQLELAGLPCVEDPARADLVVLCALAGDPEVAEALALAPRPIIAFDGVQGAQHGELAQIRLALPVEPNDQYTVAELMAGVGQARRAAQLVVAGLCGGADDRRSLLQALRRLGPFDDQGDPIDPPVWLWRADAAWRLSPERPL